MGVGSILELIRLPTFPHSKEFLAILSILPCLVYGY